MNNVAKIRFCHDLEDSWYRLDSPFGTFIERNNYVDLIKYCIENNFDYEWVGDDYYNPEKGKNPETPWLHRNYKFGHGQLPGESCCYNHKNKLCDFHNPEKYYPDYFLAANAIYAKLLAKLTPVEKQVLHQICSD